MSIGISDLASFSHHILELGPAENVPLKLFYFFFVRMVNGSTSDIALENRTFFYDVIYYFTQWVQFPLITIYMRLIGFFLFKRFYRKNWKIKKNLKFEKLKKKIDLLDSGAQVFNFKGETGAMWATASTATTTAAPGSRAWSGASASTTVSAA